MNQNLIRQLLVFILISLIGYSCSQLGRSPKQKPKNIILFISDGCGYNHIDAASLYSYGETGQQIYERFPVKYAMSTYSINTGQYQPDSAWTEFNYVQRKPTDSAAAATAISTGVKTYNGAIGIDTTHQQLETVAELFEKIDKSTGLVTTVPLSHATPAGFAAHDSSRSNYRSIAQELFFESQLDVLMGTGHPYYDDDGHVAPDTVYKYVGGSEIWQALLAGKVDEDANGDGVADNWTFIETLVEFRSLITGETPSRLVAVPQVRSTLQQNRSGDRNAAPFVVPLNQSVPTLAEMTQVALNVLDNDPDGFFVMIEGGAVDWASHANQSGRMIEEEIDFNKAVEAAVAWLNSNSSWDETLIIVTGDHECGYLTGPNSGNIVQADSTIKAVWQSLVNNGKGNLPGMEWHSGSHTNSLIPLFAHGAGSDLFHQYADEVDPVRGKYVDNTEIARVLFDLFRE